jgi:D-alanyl-lipoteichoic acid acyltransferase DltB (MBOAT superfamily)
VFQLLSYLIEVKRGKMRAERHFGLLLLYILLFPKLLAGPIERPYDLIPQLTEKNDFDYNRIADGLKRMAWGFFKKLVIAERAAIIVNEVYNNPREYWGIYLIVATLSFSFQVYCDFSGYSDIAIGAGKVLGFRLTENFKRPYFSRSISELWRRWHITLITWFRDYVYIPLGGNRVSAARWQFNTMFVFILSGIWHGANWTYVCWAGLNGLYIVLSYWTEGLRKSLVSFFRLSKVPKIHRIIQTMITFFLFTFAAIFFRSNSVSDAVYIISHMGDGLGKVFSTATRLDYNTLKILIVPYHQLTFLGFAKPAFASEMIVLFLSIIVLNVIYFIQEKKNNDELFAFKSAISKWAVYYFLLFSILFLGVFTSQQFIYFRH